MLWHMYVVLSFMIVPREKIIKFKQLTVQKM